MTQPWKTDLWFTSPWNFDTEVTKNYSFPKQIRIHDVTLRDGEQQTGVAFRKDEKIRIAEALAEAGVHRIEAGFPPVSKEDAEAVKEIAKRNLGPEISVLCRSVIDDIKLAVDCGATHVVIETGGSRHLIKYGYEWTEQKAVDVAIKATAFAKEQGLSVCFFPVDSTRDDIDWLLDLVKKVETDGYFDSLALVDTMGALTPATAAYYVRKAQARFNKPLEAHFHDDFGLATANTLVALACGADVAHVSVVGLGERAGGAALEEVVVALRACYGQDSGVKTEKMYKLCQLVTRLARHRLPHNKAVVGDQLFVMESGLAVSRLKRCAGPLSTEVNTLHWDLLGQKPPSIALGKLSGRDNIFSRLQDIGMEASKEQADKMVQLVKDRALETKRLLTDKEFRTIATQVLAEK